MIHHNDAGPIPQVWIFQNPEDGESKSEVAKFVIGGNLSGTWQKWIGKNLAGI